VRILEENSRHCAKGDFGETARLSGISYNPYLYTGQQFDPECGGHYFLRARLYYPQYGLFLSRDPIGWEGGSNVFSYCDNNPLNSSDPSGLEGLPPGYRWGSKGMEPVPGYRSTPFQDKVRSAAVALPLLATGPMLGRAAILWARMNPLKAIIAGDVTVGAVTGMPTGNMMPSSGLGGLKGNVGAAAADDFVPVIQKAVNSELPHAIKQGVERGIFPNAKVAGEALRNLSKELTETGAFPVGTLPDTAHADRFLVPVGEGGLAVYQLLKNGTARLKTVLIAR